MVSTPDRLDLGVFIRGFLGNSSGMGSLLGIAKSYLENRRETYPSINLLQELKCIFVIYLNVLKCEICYPNNNFLRTNKKIKLIYSQEITIYMFLLLFCNSLVSYTNIRYYYYLFGM